MALLRIGGINPGKRRDELLSNYDGEEPYMPGGYDTPYDGKEPWLPNEYSDSYDDNRRRYDDGDMDYDDRDYDDRDYDDRDYDDRDYDDRDYDDGYGGSSRYDDDYGYDDAYGDDDGYPPEDGYDDRGPYYGTPPYDPRDNRGGSGGLADYVYEHDWVTWVLLVLLPPVGIWLLWRRQRYSPAVNMVLSTLSAMWMVAVLYVLIAKPFRRASDTTITPQPVGVTAQQPAGEAPEEEVSAEETPAVEAEVIPTEEVDEANAVYTVAGTPYYHQSTDCLYISADAQTERVARNTAIEQSLLACPYCLGGQYSDGAFDLVFVTADTEDRSNMKVYCSAYNSHFHTDPNCSDIGGDAQEVGLKEALLMSRTACEVCCPDAAREVFCTVDGTYYHTDDECSGMRNASHVTYAEARVTGKKRCPVCIGGVDETEAAAEAAAAEAAEQASGYYVYATPKGTYYHVNSTCSGMKDAQQVLLADMLKEGRPACPKCCPDAETTVFAESGNPYFHSNATCSGMTNATRGILVNALAAGLTRCPVCWTSGDASAAEPAEGGV